MLQRASIDCHNFHGTTQGNVPMYMALEESLPQTKALERDAALVELATRYFLSHGPATLQDLVRWAGITITQARLGLEGVKSQLVEEKIDGQVYWLPSSTKTVKKHSPS